ncbi:MAG: glycoside hydrolase family 172 protein [Planctomycetota bacterium]
MQSSPLVLVLSAFCLRALPAQVTTGSLLDEMTDLSRLAELPSPPYRLVQLSSYDRRSTGSESPHWFSNADGFGGEPVPGFLEVLRKVDPTGVGEYLLADVRQPGAIVRGWSAAMDGVLRVWLDGSEKPLFEGKGYEFLARRSTRFLQQAALDLDPGNAFIQEDADYLPIPFARGLRITWEGQLRRLHFYQLGLRLYEPGTRVSSFAPKDLSHYSSQLARAIESLNGASRPRETPADCEEFRIQPGKTWSKTYESPTPQAIEELFTHIDAEDRSKALRGTLLRIHFDGSQKPQVEAPIGDFFGSGPGINVHGSLPLRVQPDGGMWCFFVMPFAKSARIECKNTSDIPVEGKLHAKLQPYRFSERSLYFRAKWRVDHELDTEGSRAPMDIPYLFVHGQGRLVGAACMIMNPSPIPTPGGSWWGEGDEKILVDGEATPSSFGTGSEDYFNYSWSRPALFDHPYCGQPLDSGPGTSGYVSNHRFHIMDDIPFQRSLAFFLECWTHNPTPGLSYGRIIYHYARPGAVDDHRRLQKGELIVPALPPREPLARGGASRSEFYDFEDLEASVSRGKLVTRALELASRGRVRYWNAATGDRLTLGFPVAADGVYGVNLVLVHRPDAGGFQSMLDGEALAFRGDMHSLRTAHATRILRVRHQNRKLSKGEHELTLVCSEPGPIGLDYLWIRMEERPPIHIAGAIEGESLRVVGHSPGLVWEKQGLHADRWSRGAQLWVKATRSGSYIDLALPVAREGVYRLDVGLTRSWDYGVLRMAVDGKELPSELDTFSASLATMRETLGSFRLTKDSVLRLEVTGRNQDSAPPGYYFGLDYVILSPAKERK